MMMTTGAASYSTELTAILDRATALGYTKPSEGVLRHMDDLIASLKVAGYWDDFDWLYVFEHDGSEEFGRINWVAPSSFTLTEVGTVTFTSNVGVKVTSTSNYYNTNWDWSNASKISQNNASIGIVTESVTPGAASATYYIGLRETNFRSGIYFTTTTQSGSITNDGAYSGGTVSPTGSCMVYSVYRTTSTAQIQTHNASEHTSDGGTSAVQAGATDWTILTQTNDGTPQSNNLQANVKAAWLGNSTVKGTNLNTFFQTYSTNVN